MQSALSGTLLSSGGAWSGIVASFHALRPGALEIDQSDVVRIAVHVGAPHRLWDAREGATHVGAHARGDVVITAVGERRSVRWDRASSLVSLQLDPKLLRALAERSGANPDALGVVGAFSHRDPVIERAAFALFGELAAGMPSGRLFGEEIAASIGARLLERHGHGASRAVGANGLRARSGLSRARLSRVVSRMHDAMSEPLSLADLASEAGLSTFHFARQFRAATGVAPHAYLIRVRVEEAARVILLGVDPSDAASAVGFSSQGHLTQHMRRLLGTTPGSLAVVARKRSGRCSEA